MEDKMKGFFRSLWMFLLGAFVGISLFIFGVGCLVFHFSAVSGKKDIPAHSFLSIDFSGMVVERPVDDIGIFSNKAKLRLIDILRAIKSAKFDDKIKFILINGDLAGYSIVHNEEILSALQDFKKANKKVYAWFSTGNNSNYLLASVADEIIMPDTAAAGLTLTGYSISIPYYKALLDRLGVGFHVVHMGDFKGMGENYTRTAMSQNLEKQYRLVYDDFYQSKLELISKNRGLDAKHLDQLMKNGDTMFMTPNEAIQYGLVDRKMGIEELISSLEDGKKLHEISISDYIDILTRIPTGNKIAVVYAEGVINNYYSGETSYPNSESQVGAKTFNADINEIIKDKSIQGVVLRVNSPGGSALASELMYQALLKLKEHKKVYVSMGNVAASGGYYISLPATKIYSSPFTLTGSIGVVSMFFDISRLTEIVGINFGLLKKNPYDDIFNIVRTPSEKEIEILRRSSQKIYQEFTSHVGENRKIEKDKMLGLAEGRIWSGKQAVELGLSDEIGTFYEAIEDLKKELGITNAQLIEYPKSLSFWEKIRGMKLAKTSVSKVFSQNDLKGVLEAWGVYQENEGRPLLYLPLSRTE